MSYKSPKKKDKKPKKDEGTDLEKTPLGPLRDGEYYYYDEKLDRIIKKSDYYNVAKGGIVKKFKGGLMVKPKAAKRGY